jgi:hypothetical protein
VRKCKSPTATAMITTITLRLMGDWLILDV